MEWRIIDGNGAFFRPAAPRVADPVTPSQTADVMGPRINWSKVPFKAFESAGGLEPEGADRIAADFGRFLAAASSAGYQSISLDDVAHLADWDGYPEPLRTRLAAYRRLYERLFAMASAQGLSILLNTDVMFYCSALEASLQSPVAAAQWLRQQLETIFRVFPSVRGVIFRFGETDALDTEGDFRSRLLIRTPRQARVFMRTLLPLFEHHDRYFIFRTWTVGAYPIGDLIWHRHRFRQVFRGFTSRHLLISMKYGETDFFRYLPLNRQFFRTGQLRTIVELQTRREYEGFGEYPSFVGWEYERLLRQLAATQRLAGVSVWCQTGGWGRFDRLTYIDRSSIWVELNTWVVAALTRGQTCEEAVRGFCREHLPDADAEAMLVFLALSDDVIRELLYVREFAAQKLFFRRLRIPPLLFVYWDRVLVTPLLRRALRHLVRNHGLCVEEGWNALRKLDLMIHLAKTHALPTQGLAFQRDTFEILAELREYLFGSGEGATVRRLHALRAAYRRRWSPRYALKFNFGTGPLLLLRIGWIRRLLLRERRGYRLFDSIVTLRLLAYVYPLLAPWRRRRLPQFIRTQAMGIDSLFK